MAYQGTHVPMAGAAVAQAVEDLNRRLRRVLQLEARARRLEAKPAA